MFSNSIFDIYSTKYKKKGTNIMKDEKGNIKSNEENIWKKFEF